MEPSNTVPPKGKMRLKKTKLVVIIVALIISLLIFTISWFLEKKLPAKSLISSTPSPAEHHIATLPAVQVSQSGHFSGKIFYKDAAYGS